MLTLSEVFARITGVRKLFGRRQGISRCWMLSTPYVMISKPECVEVIEQYPIKLFRCREPWTSKRIKFNYCVTRWFGHSTLSEVNVNDYGNIFLFLLNFPFVSLLFSLTRWLIFPLLSLIYSLESISSISIITLCFGLTEDHWTVSESDETDICSLFSELTQTWIVY